MHQDQRGPVKSYFVWLILLYFAKEINTSTVPGTDCSYQCKPKITTCCWATVQSWLMWNRILQQKSKIPLFTARLRHISLNIRNRQASFSLKGNACFAQMTQMKWLDEVHVMFLHSVCNDVRATLLRKMSMICDKFCWKLELCFEQVTFCVIVFIFRA